MKTITIANTSIPIKFGMYVLGTFLRERKLKLSDLSLLGEDLLLALEFIKKDYELTKENLLKLSEHLDKLELSYNTILKEYESRGVVSR